MAAVAPQAISDPDELDPRPGGREVPKLSIVTPDYEPNGPHWPEPASKVTRQIPQIAGPDDEEEGIAKTAAQRISAARKAQQAAFLKSTTGRLIIALAVLVLLAAMGGGYLLMKGKTGAQGIVAQTPTVAPTPPPPTPTGFGDATNTPVATKTPAPPPANVMAVNGWAVVQSSSGLSLRQTASKTGKRMTVLPNNTKVHLVEGPKDADGLKWWRVDRYDTKNPSASGWLAGQYLAPTAAP
jgi:hypothetical protein